MRRDSQYRLPPYADRCRSVGIESLSRRRLNLSAMFVYDLFSGRVDSRALLANLSVNSVTRSLRNVRYLVLERHRSNYGMFESVDYVSRAFNVFAHFYSHTIDRSAFKSLVRSYVVTDDVLKRNGFLLLLD